MINSLREEWMSERTMKERNEEIKTAENLERGWVETRHSSLAHT